MIFCIEDEESIRELMIYTLRMAGYEAKGFSESGAFWNELKTCRPQLILLDIMLPGEDGISVLKKLRSAPGTEKIPVIMATAKGSEYDKVIGLDLGADDYLCKPFGMMEMISRIKAVLRRTEQQENRSLLQYRDITMDISRHAVYIGEEKIVLTLKEYEMLRLFMENIGIVFTRDQLLTLVWDSDFIAETRTVDVHIGTLRTKLGESGDVIQTVRGVGYRME